MFTGARSVDGLFQASSQGQLGFQADTDGNGAPDVFGPFTINESGSTGDYYAWAYAAEAAATAAGVDLSLYQHRVFVLARYNELNVSWAGVANVGHIRLENWEAVEIDPERTLRPNGPGRRPTIQSRPTVVLISNPPAIAAYLETKTGTA
jgi:hypothetical protein